MKPDFYFEEAIRLRAELEHLQLTARQEIAGLRATVEALRGEIATYKGGADSVKALVPKPSNLEGTQDGRQCVSEEHHD